VLVPRVDPELVLSPLAAEVLPSALVVLVGLVVAPLVSAVVAFVEVVSDAVADASPDSDVLCGVPPLATPPLSKPHATRVIPRTTARASLMSEL